MLEYAKPETYTVGELGQFTALSDRNRDDDIPLRLSDSTI
jgi:hypothetical protein